jgi:hypothetical protein
MTIKNINAPMICGIDTLYYFIETNKNYDDMFLDILEQIEDKKAMYERKEIEYKNSDIFIEFKNITLQFLNKQEGFYWFRDTDEFFRVGFKDETKNKELHNIRVQLQGLGIYTVGLKPLLSFINDNLFKDISTGLYPITRADLNCFINYDFSFIDKTMFVSRKKKYSSISEVGSAKKTETIYIGKAPFMLRIYNKKLELEKSNKKELMYEYFENNDLDIEEEIFNVEFEMHRTHLRAYNITTLEDLLSNANTLFKKAMEDIRLIDIDSITNNDIKNNSKNRAKTLSIWNYIKDNFNIDTFIQFNFPLQRLKRKSYVYTYDKFIDDFNEFIKKSKAKGISINKDFIFDLFKRYFIEEENQKERYKEASKPKKKYIPVSIEGDNKEYRLLKSGELIEPVKVVPFRELDNIQLEKEITTLESYLHFGEEKKRTEYAQKLEIAYKEKMRRLEERL